MFSDNFTAHITIFSSNSLVNALNIIFHDSKSSDTYMQFVHQVKEFNDLIIHYDPKLHTVYKYN